MKITRQTTRSKRVSYRAIEIEDAVEMMSNGSTRDIVERARRKSAAAAPGTRFLAARTLPQLIFGGAFLKGRKGVYSGYVVLEINRLQRREEVESTKRSVAAFPQTMVAMENALGTGVVAVVRYARPDGSLPADGEMADMFHAHALLNALKIYEPELGIALELNDVSVRHAVALTYDPDIYYNPNAVTVLLEQPTAMPEDSIYRERYEKMTSMIESAMTPFEEFRYRSVQFEMAYKMALEKSETIGDDYKPLLVNTARLCFGAGIGEEETVRWCLLYFGTRLSEVEVRMTVDNVYVTEKGFADAPLVNAEQLMVLQLEEFMERRYIFRHNIITDTTEYKERHSLGHGFRPVTQRTLNSIALNAHKEGLSLWDRDVRRYVHSDRIRSYDPVDDYLKHLPAWDGKDRIRPLLRRVPTKNTKWENLGYRWMLSMVAHWMELDADHGNALSPLFIGDQGCGKSTYCQDLLPPELRQYYTDGIDLSKRRDCEQALARFLLINLDEFDQVSERYQGFLKYLQQKASVSTRRPYASSIETLKRYASFVATSNHTDLLGDPSGSRRFICVKIDGDIERGQPIDYPQLYAQIVHLLNHGERFWPTREEETQLIEDNEEFRQRPLAEDLFYKFYRPAVEGESCLKMTSGEIYQSLQEKSRRDLPAGKTIYFGRFLRRNVPLQKKAHRGTLYCIVETDE